MKQENITSTDRKSIKKNLIDHSYNCIVILLTLTLSFGYTVFCIDAVDNINNPILVKIVILIIHITLLVILFDRTVILSIKDLKSEVKTTSKAVITCKRTKNYKQHYSLNKLQPIPTQYVLYFNDYFITVDQKDYDKIRIGQNIDIYTSQYANQVLGIYKS